MVGCLVIGASAFVVEGVTEGRRDRGTTKKGKKIKR